jgi:CheY-like chemotaxis protein
VSYAREIAHIEVEDTGPGIPTSEYEKIYEPFSRGSAANQINVGGTGLGLTISKLLTELMGGELSFTSQIDKGTKFQIKLFLSQYHQEADANVDSNIKRIAYRGHRRKVLVVDNEQVDRELIINILSPLGFEVREAGNGQECISMYQQFKPDVILMDLAMPVMDGWEASYIIRKVHQSPIPIAIVSANAFDKNLENSAEISSKDFIIKPLNIEELLDWIGESLQLDWVTEVAPIEVFNEPTREVNVAKKMTIPLQQDWDELLGLVKMGYIKGINAKLDNIEKLGEEYAEFVNLMRQFAQQFQIELMKKTMYELNHDK